MSEEVMCPMCHGEGGYTEVIDPELGGPWEPCGLCKGTGIVSQSQRMRYVRSFIGEKDEDFWRIAR